MREIPTETITAVVRRLCLEANTVLGDDATAAAALAAEESPVGREILRQLIRNAEIVAYADLGTEAVRRLEVAEFPAIVVCDVNGRNLYHEGRSKYRKP